MLHNFNRWDDILNDIECSAINNTEPTRLLGYRLGYLTAKIERAYFDDELTLDEYNRLKERSEEIYIEVKR